MDKLREETVANIRGCLNSIKGTLDIHQLTKDYRQLMGCQIPYRQLGHASLEEFLSSINTLALTHGPNGQTFIHAKANQKSSHLVEMVARQKTVKKKPTMTKYAPKYPPRFTNQQVQAPNRWRPKYTNPKWQTSYENSPRPMAVAHNQFVNFDSSPQRRPQPKKPSPPPTAPTPKPIVQRNGHPQPLTPINNNTIEPTVEGFTKTRPLVNKAPNSSFTNRATIMQSSKTSPQVMDTSNFENLRAEAMAAVDSSSMLWNNWSSSSDSDVPQQINFLNQNLTFPGEPEKLVVNLDTDVMFHCSGDVMCDLFSYAKFKHLDEPVFKVIHRQAKPHKPKFYDCKVKIGQHSFSSYPKDFTDEVAAKYHVATMALEGLMNKLGIRKRQSMLLSNEEDVLERIPPLVQKHFHGIWSWQIEEDYKDQYNEQLPSNWLEVVDTIPTISVEQLSGPSCILRFCTPEDLLQKGKHSTFPLINDVSIPSSSVHFTDKFMVAVVTCAVSANEIWCRQLNIPEALQFDAMMLTMADVYNKEVQSGKLKCAESIRTGSFYAAYMEDTWHRVRSIAMDGDTVECWLVDRGDGLWLPKTSLYTLRREFAKATAQAFLCRLAGLEELYDISINSEHLQNLENTTVQLEVIDDENMKSQSASTDPICVVMYDGDTGQPINQELIGLINIEVSIPTLQENAPNEVYVSHVESNGDIYVQVRSQGYKKLMSTLAELEEEVTKNPPKQCSISKQDNLSRLYFLKAPGQEHFHRVRIIEWAPMGSLVQGYYVDQGSAPVIDLKKSIVYALDELNGVASRYAEQAVVTQLDVVDIDSNTFVDKVNSIMPPDTVVLLRIVGHRGTKPLVKIFVRIQEYGLVSVNESIAIENICSRASTDLKLTKIKQLESMKPSSGNLSSPKLPEIGEYFNVKIPNAVSPSNFFVQPFDSYQQLCEMMVLMQTHYASSKYSPLLIDDIITGKIYASKYEDGRWYRTSVLKVIHSGSISVFYCDFGSYATLSLQQLFPLGPEFLSLPHQAIKAKLTGIKAIQQKWTMDDCKYFQKLVVNKTFVSALTSIEKDELFKADIVLGLKLIDTRTEKDVFVEAVLIQKKIAVPVKAEESRQ